MNDQFSTSPAGDGETVPADSSAIILDKAAIMCAVDRRPVQVYVPEWGGSVSMRVLSGGEREEYESMLMAAEKSGKWSGLRGWLLLKSLCDPSGNPLFTKEEVKVLEQKNAIVFVRLANEALGLSMLKKASVEEEAGN